MPLARILTLRPEETTGLSEQLQQLGFDVEVTSPHERNLSAAELEIEFAICDQQQVLGRAAAIATQLQADVVVFSGALPPLPKRVVVEEAPVTLPESLEVQPPSESVEIPAEQEPEPVLTPTEQDSIEEAERIPRSAIFVERLRKLRSQTGSAARVLAGKVRSSSGWMKAVVAGTIVRLKSSTSAAADRTRLYQERMRARAARAQAARALRLAEMERLRAQAREQVAALEKVRMVVEAQHQQLQRMDAEQEPVRHRKEKVAGPRSLQMRGVLAGAATAVALFVAGILLANFHTSSPLSPAVEGSSIEQQVPFGPATVHGAPGVTLTPKAPKTLPPIAARVPLSASASRPASRPKPAVHTTQAKNHNPAWRHFRNKSSAEKEDVADDVTVRHFGAQKKPTTQTAQRQTGIKRYSDQ